jgi:hypothetical protein
MLLSQAAVLDIATRSIKAVSVPFAAWIRETTFSQDSSGEAAEVLPSDDLSAGRNDEGLSSAADSVSAVESGSAGLLPDVLADDQAVEELVGDDEGALVEQAVLSGVEQDYDARVSLPEVAGGFAGVLPYFERVVGGRSVKVVDGRALRKLLCVSQNFTTWTALLFERLELQVDVDFVVEKAKGDHSLVIARQVYFTEAAARAIVMAVNPPRAAELLGRLRARLMVEGSTDEGSDLKVSLSCDESAGQEAVGSVSVEDAETEAGGFVAPDVAVSSLELVSPAETGVDLAVHEAVPAGDATLELSFCPTAAVVGPVSEFDAGGEGDGAPDQTEDLLSLATDVAILAAVQVENGETMHKSGGDQADVAGGQQQEPVAPVIVYSAATMPLTMEEFLRVVGVPESMAGTEAVIREAELALDVMGHGTEFAGFRHPATGAWLFHRPILLEWWEKAASTVAASIRSRFS